jgi:hypothetical protein
MLWQWIHQINAWRPKVIVLIPQLGSALGCVGTLREVQPS